MKDTIVKKPTTKIAKKPIIQLVYASMASKPFTKPDLDALLLTARTNNTKLDVTGLLLYHKLSFFQILEGLEENVYPLFTHIEADKRHHGVLLLLKSEVKERCFTSWSMGFIDSEPTAKHQPGFVKLMEAKASFLDLHGDTKMVTRLLDGFHEGRWRKLIV